MVEWYVLLIIATLLVGGLQLTGATSRLDNAVYDVALKLRQVQAPDNIVIVGIDMPSVGAQGVWPWPRRVLAAMVRRIARDHPKAVVLDAPLQTGGDSPDDRKLIEAMGLAPVYLPQIPSTSKDGSSTVLNPPAPAFVEAAAGTGLVAPIPDDDGIVRRIQLAAASPAGAVPNLMLTLAGRPAPPPQADAKSRSPFGQTAGLADRQDEALIPFTGPAGHYRRISAADVLSGAVPDGAFKGKYVLIGPTASDLLDDYPTPVAGAVGMPNIEIQANVLEGLLSHRMILSVPGATSLALSMGVVWVLFFGFLQLQPGQMAIQGLLGSLLYLTACIFTLALIGLWFPPTPAVITRTLIEVIWSSRRLQAASDYLARELAELQTRAGGALAEAPRGFRLAMGDSVSRQMALIDETRRRVRALRRFVTDVLAGFPDPVFVVSPRGRIIMLNQAATTLGQRLGHAIDPGEQVQPILEDLEKAAGDKDKLWPPPETPAEFAPRGVGPGGRILEARYTPTGYENGQVNGWTVHLVDVTALVSAMRQREGALQLFSHDMRSPQSAILAALEHKDFQNVPDNLRASIEKNALRTLSLADGFVRLAQAEGSEYLFEQIDLFHLVSDAADALWPLAQSAKVEINVEDPEREFVINADRGLLARAFINLMDNAVKYSPSGGVVSCTFSETTLHGRPAVSCVIADQGPGMTDEQMKTLFTRFARPRETTVDAERRSSRRRDAVGLGLAVVHTVVSRHDGTVECRSAVGVGTAFNVTIPLCPAELLEEEMETEDA